MRGRDPHESGRVACTLELLFDLTFVVAVATGASQLAHRLAEGHVTTGVGAFVFTSFGIIWAWMNYSWFASAYDTDDWLYRLLTVGPAAASSAASTLVTGFSSGSKYVQ